MRIVAGTWGGRILTAPQGERTRPTSDRVREALFSMLEARFPGHLDGATVLDAFAGSGALALESLSRGAATATLVDDDRAALVAVTANVETLGADGTHIVRADAFRLARAVAVPGSPFSLLLLDPPYRIDGAQVTGLLSDLEAGGHIAPSAVVVYEHDSADDVLWPSGFEPCAERKYGDTTVSLAVFRGETECR